MCCATGSYAPDVSGRPRKGDSCRSRGTPFIYYAREKNPPTEEFFPDAKDLKQFATGVFPLRMGKQVHARISLNHTTGNDFFRNLRKFSTDVDNFIYFNNSTHNTNYDLI